MPSDSFIPPRPSSSLQLTRASLVSVDGCTTCRANTTCFQRRAFPIVLPSALLSLTDDLQRVDSAVGN